MDRIENLKEYVEAALNQVCFGTEADYPLEATVARYFHPEYRQVTDGEELDYAGVVDHMRLLRQRVPSGRIDVLEALQDGDQVADRHLVHAVKPDGGEIETEVYLFGWFAGDGRLIRVVETSRMVRGAAGDADLASAR
jgi:hypothetical protein